MTQMRRLAWQMRRAEDLMEVFLSPYTSSMKGEVALAALDHLRETTSRRIHPRTPIVAAA